MPGLIERKDLAALIRGTALLGGGGGGDPQLLGQFTDAATPWPVQLFNVTELDPDLPCLAVGIGGSTLLLGERLPDTHPFDLAIEAVQRWTGERAEAVCAIQIGGINGLVPLPLTTQRHVVDADLMGRALSSVDQFALFAEGLPGLVLAAATGGSGVLLHSEPRAEDAEHILRAAFESAGGWSGAVLGGFRVGDLAGHAIPGSVSRAITLGAASLAATPHDPESLARDLGAQLLGTGRVHAVEHDVADHRCLSLDIRCRTGDVLRLIAGSEYQACLCNGEPLALAPTIISVVDAASGHPVTAETISSGRRVHVLSLAAPEFWTGEDHRMQRVGPTRYGLEDLQVIHG